MKRSLINYEICGIVQAVFKTMIFIQLLKNVPLYLIYYNFTYPGANLTRRAPFSVNMGDVETISFTYWARYNALNFCLAN